MSDYTEAKIFEEAALAQLTEFRTREELHEAQFAAAQDELATMEQRLEIMLRENLDAKHRLATVTAERDALKSVRSVEGAIRIRDERNEARTQRDALREALQEFVDVLYSEECMMGEHCHDAGKWRESALHHPECPFSKAVSMLTPQPAQGEPK